MEDSQGQARVLTFLFTDIEGSTALWEQDGTRMSQALAAHDALARSAVESRHGRVVKITGDGIHATFDDALDALVATVDMQQALADPAATNGVALRVRCGLHAGVVERRDNDYFGSPVNRAARIMSAAHGGQILLSQVVAELVRERLPVEVSLRDLGSVRLRDMATPEHVYQALHPRLPATFPALRSLAATPSNLPQQVTPFIGRERELGEIRKLLISARLLTLVGIGGIGKTRLSLEIAANVLDNYFDGAWFVDLAPVADARLVPQVVAFVLGVREEAGCSVNEALVKFVKDRRLLLILDNCEHVAQACAALVKELSQAGPDITVLMTSREPLHLAGETTYSVRPLALPTSEPRATSKELLQYEAIQFFIDRAAAAVPGFALTDGTASAIVDICRRLDGLPLALELAAARVRSLPVVTIADRVRDRFRVVAGGDKTRAPRQQTLTALIDWSYDLLEGRERVLLQRLSVFAGSFTLEAAESVAGGGELDEHLVFDALIQLAEKSLVVLERNRYRLLETVRQYAHERLARTGDEDDVRARYVAYFVALAEKARPELEGASQGEWLAQIDLERDNLLAVHAWCDRLQDGGELGLRLIYAIRLYWPHVGLLPLGHRLTMDALARPGAETRDRYRFQATFLAGHQSLLIGDNERALPFLEESLEIARELRDENCVSRALGLVGGVYLDRGDLEAARAHLEEELALARKFGKTLRLAYALCHAAALSDAEGLPDAAAAHYEEALSIFRALGTPDSIAGCLLDVTENSIKRGLAERARSTLREAVDITIKLDCRWTARAALDSSAAMCAFAGQFERAARFYGASTTHSERMGIKRSPTTDAFLAPFMVRSRDALGATVFAAAISAGNALAYEQAMAEAAACLTVDVVPPKVPH